MSKVKGYHATGFYKALLKRHEDGLFETESLTTGRPSQRIYGIEVELEFKSPVKYDDALDYFEEDNGVNTLERDGSLNYGFEVISHPMSLEVAKWYLGSDYIVPLWDNSRGNAGTNGLHIHVFDSKSINKQKLLYLGWVLSDKLALLTRRSSYASFLDESFSPYSNAQTGAFLSRLATSRDAIYFRRGAFNVMPTDRLSGGTRDNHVEFRFFNVPDDCFTARTHQYLNFIEQILDLCRKHSMDYLIKHNWSIKNNFEIVNLGTKQNFDDEVWCGLNVWDEFKTMRNLISNTIAPLPTFEFFQSTGAQYVLFKALLELVRK